MHLAELVPPGALVTLNAAIAGINVRGIRELLRTRARTVRPSWLAPLNR
jgi:hypothetical protein